MGREVRELYMERQKARLVMCQWGTSKGLVHGERARPLLTRVDPLLSVQMAPPDSHLATWCSGTCILHIARKLDFQTFAPAYVLPATMYSWYIIHNSTFYSGWKLLRRYDIVCEISCWTTKMERSCLSLIKEGPRLKKCDLLRPEIMRNARSIPEINTAGL